MKSNFVFLQDEWPELAKLGQEAESYLYSDPNVCMYKLGQLMEQLVKKLLEVNEIRVTSDRTHSQRIYDAYRNDLTPKEIYDYLNKVRVDRNEAAHKLAGSITQAKEMLQSAYQVSCWFMKKYSRNRRFKPDPYHEPQEHELKNSIIDNRPSCLNTFVGREAELKEIHEKLLGQGPVFISGIRGIGKTELAKSFAQKYGSEYDVIRFADYNGSIEELITSGALAAIENDTNWHTMLDSFTELLNERTLLIIDNYSISKEPGESDQTFFARVSSKCKLLVTTAENLHAYYRAAQTVELGALENQEQYNLFEKEYGKALSGNEEIIAKQILSRIQGYTLLIPLIAKLLSNSSLGFQSVSDKITEAGALSLSGKIRHIKDSSRLESSIKTIVQSVMDLSSLSEEERFVLRCISALKGIKIERALLINWIGSQYEDTINDLYFKRWLNVDGTGSYAMLSLHGVVRDVVLQDTSYSFKTGWIQKAVEYYYEIIGNDLLRTHLSHAYPDSSNDYKREPGEKRLGTRPTGIAAIQISNMRLLLKTLFQSIDIEKEPETLIGILFQITNCSLDRAYNYAPDCDEQLSFIENSRIYDALTFNEQINLHTLRIFYSIKSLFDCEHAKSEEELLSLCSRAIAQSDKVIGMLNDYECNGKSFSILHRISKNAFLDAGIAFGTYLFTTRYPEYSTEALKRYSDYTNYLAEILFERFPDYLPYNPGSENPILYYNLQCFNKRMLPGSYEKEWSEERKIRAQIAQEEEEWDWNTNYNVNNMSPQERSEFEIEQWIGKPQFDADEIVHQCEQLGYSAVEDPDKHPEIQIDHLSDSAVLNKASEMLSLAKYKYTTSFLFKLQYYGFDNDFDTHLDRIMYRWLLSSCIHSCCKNDFSTAKEYYLRHLQASSFLFPSDEEPNLKMYNTLKHLGFFETAQDILRINVQHLEDYLSEHEIKSKDPDINWLYNQEQQWDAICRILEFAEILGDDNLIAKYRTIKNRLEHPGFEPET